MPSAPQKQVHIMAIGAELGYKKSTAYRAVRNML
jgi:predicted transcriptional regulator